MDSPRGGSSETDRLLRAMRRNAMIWGAIVALLIASIAVEVVRIIDHPGIVTIVCDVHGSAVSRCAGDER